MEKVYNSGIGCARLVNGPVSYLVALHCDGGWLDDLEEPANLLTLRMIFMW